jgi:2-dehydropantoate 2-reductase
MKIAVVGCGAVGSFYGASLARAGHQVHFLLRSDYETVRRDGVRIEGAGGDFVACPHCARRPEEIGPSDLVLIGLKTTANDQFSRLLPPLVGSASAVLTLQNGLGNEEQLAALFPVEQVMGGLCFVCLNRLAPGVVRHFGFGQVVLGEFQRPPSDRTHELATCFREAGVRCMVTENLAQAHWEKLVWNIPFNGLGVASAVPGALKQLSSSTPAGLSGTTAAPVQSQSARLHGQTVPPAMDQDRAQAVPTLSSLAPQRASLSRCLTTDQLLADERWAKLVGELMLEVIAAARALGFQIPEAFADELIARTRKMGAYKASTLIDFERGQALELDSLLREPLRQATRVGVPMPRLSALCAALTPVQSAP